MCVLIQRRIEKHGQKFVAGTDNVTIADCKMAHMFYSNVYNDANPMPAEERKKLEDTIAKYPLAHKYINSTMR